MSFKYGGPDASTSIKDIKEPKVDLSYNQKTVDNLLRYTNRQINITCNQKINRFGERKRGNCLTFSS